MIFSEKIKTIKRTKNPINDCLKLQKWFLDNNKEWLFIDYEVSNKKIIIVGVKGSGRIKLQKILNYNYYMNITFLYLTQKYLLGGNKND